MCGRFNLIRMLLPALLMFLSACNSSGPQPLPYQLPVVEVVSVQSMPGMRFDVALRILNPNDFDLYLDGVSWTLDIEGNRVLTAVGNSLPVIPAYGEGEVRLSGTPSVLNTARLIMELGNTAGNGVSYVLNARLDPAGNIRVMNVRDSGVLRLEDAF